MAYTVIATGPGAPAEGFHIRVEHARTALSLLTLCRETYGDAIVQNGSGRVIDAEELARLTDLEHPDQRREPTKVVLP